MRIFSRQQHFCRPIQSRVGVAAANGFDKCRNGIVVHIAVFIILKRPFLYGFFGDFERYMNDAVFIRLGAFNR